MLSLLRRPLLLEPAVAGCWQLLSEWGGPVLGESALFEGVDGIDSS